VPEPVSSGSPEGIATTRRREPGLWAGAMRRVWRSPLGAIGVIVVGLVSAVAILAPFLAPCDPYVQFAGQELAGPLTRHLLGADELGRDILSRLIYGTRISLLVGIVSVALGVGIGMTAGLLAGYLGGWVESTVMRISDALLAFPAILLGIAVAVVLGPGIINAAIAVGIISIPQFARISRASVLVEKEKEYVQAARAGGLGDLAIVFRHVLPNTMAPLLIQMTLAMAYAVLLEAGLSFLGLGAQPPEPSWGSMLNTSRNYLRQAPLYGIFPGVALSLFLLGLNFLSDAVRDALDPRQKELL
jgi:peptide/nickel transport system permease protein